MRRIAIELPWARVGARAGAFGIPGAASRLSPSMRRVHQSRCARALALELLAEQGAPEFDAIRKDPRGRPQWPAGFTGSLAHTDGYALAATAARRDCLALGVDVEPVPPRLEDGPACLTSSIRQCVHKAIEPLREAWIECAEVDIEIDLAGGRFTPRPLSPRARAAFDGLHAQGVVRRMEGHWMLVLALFDAARPGPAGRLG